MTIQWMYGYIASWARAECRDIEVHYASPASAQALETMLDSLERAEPLSATESARYEQVWRDATDAERAALGLSASPKATGLLTDRLATLRQLLRLAVVAGTNLQLQRASTLVARTKLE
jgi:hypothetical protein